ncbi:hypothetical protein LTR94_034805, partial [Friedmanniomyces endolithicus]
MARDEQERDASAQPQDETGHVGAAALGERGDILALVGGGHAEQRPTTVRFEQGSSTVENPSVEK